MTTSALAGVVLAGGALEVRVLAPLGAGVLLVCLASALFAAGDPSQPAIPSWPAFRTGRGAVGLALLTGALPCLAFGARAHGGAALGAGLMLGASVVAADWWLRGQRARPIAVGLERALVYLTAAATVSARPPGAVWAAAAAIGCYSAGAALAVEKKLRTPARQASGVALCSVPLAYGPLLVHDRAGAICYGLLLAWVLFTSVDAVIGRRASLVRWLAGASLFDALVIAGHGAPRAALMAGAGFALTVALGQRRR